MGWLTFGVVISTALFILIGSFFGWRFDVVTGKSMEPVFSQGGLVVTRPAESKDIMLGDTVLLRLPNGGGSICHRVVDINEIDGQLFLETKGDANKYPDPGLVSSQNLVGKTAFYLPRVANVAYLSRLHQPVLNFMGREFSIALLFIVAVGSIIAAGELQNIWEWTFTPDVYRRREIRKKRRERLLRGGF